MKYFGKPTEKDILSIRDFRDDGYQEAMLHANHLLGFETQIESRKSRKHNKRGANEYVNIE